MGDVDGNASRAVLSDDTFDTCVSRMEVDVSCSTQLNEGQFWNVSVSGNAFHTEYGPDYNVDVQFVPLVNITRGQIPLGTFCGSGRQTIC